MKKLSILLTLALPFLFSITGCLKDKDFEGEKYGIQVREAKAVSFPQTASSPVIVGITGSPNPVTVAGPFITVEAGGSATANINVKLAYDQSLVTAQGLTPLPAGTFNLNTLDVVVPRDSSFVRDLRLTVLNSDQLDPNLRYGVGLRIVSADNGYQVAANMRTVVIGFTIKNKYDGIYRLQGYHNRPNLNYPYDVTIHLVTRGPNEVNFYWPEVRSNGHPIGTGPGLTSWYGADVSPSIVFNTSTNLVTNVYNLSSAVPITMFTGAGSGVSRFEDDPVPTNRKIYVYFNYNGNPQRAFFDTLTYIGPRP